MTMGRLKPNLLLVEGEKDKRVIPQLMEKFVIWGERNEPEKWPAEIKSFGGIENMLKPGVIEAELKTSGLRSLGVLADANADPVGRWKRIRPRAMGKFPNIPEDLPQDGLICQNEGGLKFGVWLMPDNAASGMIETFLSLFVPDRAKGLWPFVGDFCENAKRVHGAPFKDGHVDKAQIYAWLALQDEPGEQLHTAVLKKLLQPTSPLADPFVNWFCKLFEVERSAALSGSNPIS